VWGGSGSEGHPSPGEAQSGTGIGWDERCGGRGRRSLKPQEVDLQKELDHSFSLDSVSLVDSVSAIDWVAFLDSKLLLIQELKSCSSPTPHPLPPTPRLNERERAHGERAERSDLGRNGEETKAGVG
jgi:hypothetical protein